MAKRPSNPQTAPSATPGSAVPRLSDEQIDLALKNLPEWGRAGDAIQRTFAFKNFVEAMGFVDKVADVAESVQHHPDILIRYNKVTMTLSTHDAGGISQKDFELAQRMDAMA